MKTEAGEQTAAVKWRGRLQDDNVYAPESFLFIY